MDAQNIALYSFVVISIILMLFAFMVLWKIFRDDISLEGLLSGNQCRTASARQACRASSS